MYKSNVITGILIFLFTIDFSYCQTNSSSEYLAQEEDNTISILVEKESHEDLTTAEYKKLIKAYYDKNDFANGMLYSDKLIESALLNNDTTTIVRSYFDKMKGLYFLHKLQDAIHAGEQTMPFLRAKDSVLTTDLYFRLGILYNELGDNKSAYQLYKKISIPVVEEKKLTGAYYNNFSNIYLGLGKKDSSFIFIKKSFLYDINNGSLDDIIFAYNNIANSYIDNNQSDTAIKYLDSLTQIIKDNNKEIDLYAQKRLNQSYYQAFKQFKNIDASYYYLDELRRIDEEIYSDKLEKEIAALKNAYKREKDLKQKVEFSGIELEKSKQQRLWITIGLLLLLIILGIIATTQRFKTLRTQRDTVVMEQRLLRSQMTPHFIFNSLSVIQGMILNNENKKASSYLSKFSRLVRMILENSRFKMVTIESELLTIKNYIELQNSRFSKKIEYNININETVSLDDLIPPMIIQPFIENVIEHAFTSTMEKHQLEVELKKVNTSIECIIIDNGIGINSTKNKDTNIKKSLSTTISKERLNILAKELKTQGDIVITDRSRQNKKGTIVTVTIPFKASEE